MEQRLTAILGPSAAAAARNTDRLLTWGSHFAETDSRTWSYDDELTPASCASVTAGLPLASAEDPGVAQSVSLLEKGTSRANSPSKKRRRTALPGQGADTDVASARPSNTSKPGKCDSGASGSAVDSCGDGDASASSSDESDSDCGESSVSSDEPESGATRRRQERERIRDCQREMQLKQQTLDTTMLTSPALAAGIAFPALPPGPTLEPNYTDGNIAPQKSRQAATDDPPSTSAALSACRHSASGTPGRPHAEDKPPSPTKLSSL